MTSITTATPSSTLPKNSNLEATPSRPPIVLIHGYRGSPLGLTEIAVHLSLRGYRVFNLNVPPFGDSTPLETYTKNSYADFIASCLRDRQITCPVLVGHSMGSLIAAGTAEKYPDLLADRIVFLAPIAAKPARPIAVLSPFATKIPRNVVDFTTTAYLMIPQPRLGTAKKSLDLTRASSKTYTSKEDVVACGRFSCSHAIGDFNFKARPHLLAGAKDRLIPRKQTEKLSADLAARGLNPKTVFIKGTGHLLNYEQPAETTAEIIKFIEND